MTKSEAKNKKIDWNSLKAKGQAALDAATAAAQTENKVEAKNKKIDWNSLKAKGQAALDAATAASHLTCNPQ